jgi:hypothetical protein
VDLNVPVVDPQFPSGHAYVGTLKRTNATNGVVTYEGPIQPLNSSVLRRDVQFAALYSGPHRPVYLKLSEYPQQGPRQRRPRLKATLALASGQFSVEAR